ncbi:hypothetical protein [Flagellimonas sp.]|uniref:hypothetical protein n=1 Tax=Flagellimonas sp. TaxID=2058762 RepID=UPI003AB58973
MTAELLAVLLRRMGCDTLVTSVRDFDRTIKQWGAHVAIVNTPGKSLAVKEKFPNVKVVWLDGEGFLPDEFSHAKTMSNDKSLFRASDLILLWGDFVKRQLMEAMQGENVEKIKVTGNPTYDLIRFAESDSKADTNSVGVVMRFGTINNHLGIPPTRTLPNPDNLGRVIVECQSFVGIIRGIQAVLENTDCNVSLRPHPLEQLESYKLYKHYWFKKEHLHRITLDETLSFSHWAREQRAILSPTSTSLLEAYLLEIPVINIDRLSGTAEFAKNYAELTDTWQKNCYQPADANELASMLGEELPKVQPSESLDSQLATYCNFDGKGVPASYLCAKHISDLAFQTAKGSKRFRLPTVVVDAIDRLSFHRAMKKNPLHHNLSYRRGYHQLPKDIGSIAQNVWSAATLGRESY